MVHVRLAATQLDDLVLVLEFIQADRAIAGGVEKQTAETFFVTLKEKVSAPLFLGFLFLSFELTIPRLLPEAHPEIYKGIQCFTHDKIAKVFDKDEVPASAAP
jgi:hypothetical protein